MAKDKKNREVVIDGIIGMIGQDVYVLDKLIYKNNGVTPVEFCVTQYRLLTDEEYREKCRESAKDSWKKAVQNDQTELSFQEYAKECQEEAIESKCWHIHDLWEELTEKERWLVWHDLPFQPAFDDTGKIVVKLTSSLLDLSRGEHLEFDVILNQDFIEIYEEFWNERHRECLDVINVRQKRIDDLKRDYQYERTGTV